MSTAFKMRFPATSANLGPAFDTAAVALSLWLDVEATPAQEFAIEATGRDCAVCSAVEHSLILQTYRDILHANGVVQPPTIALRIHNDIPLGMGLGSSAAARLAGICLALRFGGLTWTTEQIMAEAIRLEDHPDNAVSCWVGGFTVAAPTWTSPVTTCFARFEPPPDWSAILVVQENMLATGKARAALPEVYTRMDAVKNVQATALLIAAFAQQRGDLLKAAMQDTMHQPYRSQFCPLLPSLIDMNNLPGVLGIALSGSGPGVLIVVDQSASKLALNAAVRERTAHLRGVETIWCNFAGKGALNWFRTHPK